MWPQQNTSGECAALVPLDSDQEAGKRETGTFELDIESNDGSAEEKAVMIKHACLFTLFGGGSAILLLLILPKDLPPEIQEAVPILLTLAILIAMPVYMYKTMPDCRQTMDFMWGQRINVSMHCPQLLCCFWALPRKFVLAHCKHDGNALRHASEKHKTDKEIVLASVLNCGVALEFASEKLQNDREVALAAVVNDSSALQFASQKVQDDREVVLAACSRDGLTLQFASQKLQDDKEVALAACSQDGFALAFASEALRANKEVVMTAINNDPGSLKFGLAGLNQDRDCLIKAGLWDDSYCGKNNAFFLNNNSLTQPNKKKIVLSTKFSLAAKSSAHATRFTVELKKHPYIANGNFEVYSPNAFNKGTCDPEWTNMDWPCQGTHASCHLPSEKKTGVPQADSCWRYSFRYHLEEASRLGGIMIQVVDSDDAKTSSPQALAGDVRVALPEDDLYKNHTLGDGQAIEAKMAKDVGIKVFRFFQPSATHKLRLKKTTTTLAGLNHDDFKRQYKDCTMQAYADSVGQCASEIETWYKGGQSDRSVCNVQLEPIKLRTVL